MQAGFYDLAIDGRNDIRLSVSTLDGMFGKPAPMPEEGKNVAKTRGAMLTELAQKPMSVIEYVQTSDGMTIVGEPYTAYTEDGFTWGGSHIQQNSNAVSRTLHAIYPSSESYTIDPAAGLVKYTTPESSADQSDLLYAVEMQSLGTEKKETVHLTFDHLLTAVRFKVGSQQLPMSVIRSISIDGIATSATLDISDGKWYLANNNGKVSCSLNFNVAGAENIVINGGESTFMLLPQALTPNAKVTIEYEDYTEGEESTNGTKTLTASLATSSTPAWEAGQCITYTLIDKDEKGEYVLDVEEPKEFSPDGGTNEAKVICYRQDGGVRTPMKWMVQSYSSDGGRTWMSGGATNVPKGMSISPTEGTSVEATSISVTLFAADSICAPHRDFLRYRTPLGYDGEAFDLSRHDYLNAPCAQTTANCYVVDAPGKYRIPTAYGNAIVDGKTNKDAYTDKAGYKHSDGSNFMTHNGKAITAPMIKNNGITLSRATLVWEDVDNLIDPNSIKLVDDGNAIEFEILPENIDQGNAVIAAMDGNNVVWSWHIWVTDEKAMLAEPIEDKNKYGEQVDFMPLTLGWCSTAKASGQIGREAAVRITMPEYLSKQACIRIRQNSTPAKDLYKNTAGNATYYNWGRKDPFPGAISTDNGIDSDNNAQALPKSFYQAGTEGASLGLHAELHTEYGADILSLLGQGALVGLNGYLTGYSIANLIKGLKNLPHAVTENVDTKNVISSGKSLVDGSAIELPAENADEAMDMLGDFLYKTDWSETDLVTEDVAEMLKHNRAINYSKMDVVKETKYGFKLGNDLYGDPDYFYTVYKVPLEDGGISFMGVMYKVTHLTIVKTVIVGNYSSAILSTIGTVLSVSSSAGSIFSNASLFKGSTDWCKEMSSHGVSVNYGIQHPNILLRDPISWINHDGVGNLWNAAQTGYDDMNTAVVKTIYDPCPAGYCVPSARSMSGINDKTSEFGFKSGTYRYLESGKTLAFPALGYRNFWTASEPGASVNNNINDQIFFNGEMGFYWTSSPAINQDEDGEKGAYVINFRGEDSYDDYGEDKGVRYTPRVINDLKLQSSYAMPIRPVREK